MDKVDNDASRSYLFQLASVALTVFVVMVAKPVLVPLALAILLAFILSPVVGLVQRTGLGRLPSTLLTLALAATLATVLAVVIGSQVAKLAGELPNHQAEIAEKIRKIRGAGTGGPFSRLANMVHELAQKPADANEAVAPPVRVKVDETSTLSRTVEPILVMLEPVATAGLVIVLMIFILLGREDLRGRFLAMLGRGRMIRTVRVLEDSADRVGKYLLFQLMVNASLGIMLGIGLAVMGVPYAPLWAFLTAIFRFIPFVGTWVAVLMPLSLSFATAPDWHQPVMVLAYFIGLDLVTANVIEPLLFGHHTGVSPIALLVAAAFWAWVWGPIGLLLSTPLTVCLAVLGQHIPTVRTLGLLLGDKPALAPHIDYYQRVLADGGPASQPAVIEAAALGMIAAFDNVLIPALALAHRDRTANALTAAEELAVRTAAVAAIAPVRALAPAAPAEASALVVVATPAHQEPEEVPLHMLAAAVEQTGGRVVVLTTRLMPAEVVRQVAASGAGAVVISNLPPGGLPQILYLCELLRGQYTDLPIIVARWGGRADYDQRLIRLRKAGASYLTTTLAQTVAQLRASAVPAPAAAALPAAPGLTA